MSGQTSALQALMHLLKGYIGTGILAMPKAFSYSGIIIGFIGTPFIGLLCHICIHQLIEINDYLCQKLSIEPMDFEDIAEKSLTEGPKRLRRYSKLSRFIVVLFLFLAQMGFCCTYYLFIAKNLRQFFINLEVTTELDYTVKDYLMFILPFMVLISYIRSIKTISIGSMFANFMLLVSFGIIIYNLVTGFDKNSSINHRKLFDNKVPQFFSTTMFTYEGITVTMGLYRSMRCRKNFAKTFGVINIAIVIVIILYTVVGFLGYLKYGDQVSASITLSLPNQGLYNSVLLLYSVAITVSYTVQLYVAIHLIWPLIIRRLEDFKLKNITIKLCNYGFRTVLVLLSFILAYLIPKLDLILSLMGAISCSMVAIIVPPILHTITFWEVKTNTIPRIWMLSLNSVIIVFGILGFTIGTYFSLQDIVNSPHV